MLRQGEFWWTPYVQLGQMFHHSLLLPFVSILELQVEPCCESHSFLISLIAKYPLCADDVLTLQSRYQSPDIIPLKLKQFIMHSFNPTFILKSFLNFSEFNL